MIFRTFDPKNREQKVLPIRYTDSGRELRLFQREMGADENARFDAVFSAPSYCVVVSGNAVILCHNPDDDGMKLMIISEGRDDFGMLQRLFPSDVAFSVELELVKKGGSPGEVVVRSKIGREQGATAREEAAANMPPESLESMRERATMAGMIHAEKASLERVSAWLKARSEAISNGANTLGATQAANETISRFDEAKGKRRETATAGA